MPLPVVPGHSLSPSREIEKVWAAGTTRPAPSGRRLAAPLDTLRGLMAQGKATCYLTQPHSCSSTGLAHWTG